VIDDCRALIQDLYQKVVDSLFLGQRDIFSASLQVLASLFAEFLGSCTTFTLVDNYFDGNGAVADQLASLVLRVANSLNGRLELVFSQMLTFELRLQSRLIGFSVA